MEARPLVIRFGAFGDIVLLTPLLRALHARYGVRCFVMGSGPWMEPLLWHHPDVFDTFRLASRKRPYWLDASQRDVVARLQMEAVGPVYVCDDYAVGKVRWLLRRARITPERGVFANPDCLLGPDEHWIDRWHRFAQMAPTAFAAIEPLPDHPAGTDAPLLYVDAKDRLDLDAWLRAHSCGDAPLVLVQPGNKRTMKRRAIGRRRDDKYWPIENWATLIRAILARQPAVRVMLCGAPAEATLLQAIAAAACAVGRVVAAGAELPVRRLLALCERAIGMVSVDTGPAQAAAALGCPVVVLYGCERTSLWRPRSPTGSDVTVLGGPPERHHVDEIPVEEVLAAWAALHLRYWRQTEAPADAP